MQLRKLLRPAAPGVLQRKHWSNGETLVYFTKNPKHSGDVAQLVERFHGMEKVLGSNPCISTKFSEFHSLH